MNLPPNLAALGHKRLVGPPEPDMETLRLNGSSIIVAWGWLQRCLYRLGSHPSTIFPTSGYREDPDSAHGHAQAIDIGFMDAEELIRACRAILFWRYQRPASLIQRVGIYPHRLFIHIDTMPDTWIAENNKWYYWVEGNDRELYGQEALRQAIEAAEEEL